MNRFIILLDIILISIVGYFTWFLATDYQTFQGRYHLPFVIWTIDTIDLFIHEGGHFVFGFLGRMVYFMGGSLMQIILPALSIWVFLKSGFRTLIGSLYWLGQNLVNVSVYIGDAPFKRLPLISDSAIHEPNKKSHPVIFGFPNVLFGNWNWILGHAGMIDSAATISHVVLALGIISCCGALITAFYFLVVDVREVILSA